MTAAAAPAPEAAEEEFDPLGWAADAVADLVSGRVFDGPAKVAEAATLAAEEATDGAEGTGKQSAPASSPAGGVTINFGDLFRKPKRADVKPGTAAPAAAASGTEGGEGTPAA